MRTWTLALSIAAHLVAIVAVVVAPLFATDELPTPRRSTRFINVVRIRPPQTDVVRPRAATTPVPSSSSAPLSPPVEIRPEAPTPPTLDVTIASGPVPDGIGVPGGFDGSGVVEPPGPPRPAARPDPVRPGGDIMYPTKVHHVAPVYPALARSARKEGIVILEAVIDEAGAVRDVRVLRSEPLLDAAAVEAVRQWRFTPTRLNGEPVPVVMTVTVAFSLR